MLEHRKRPLPERFKAVFREAAEEPDFTKTVSRVLDAWITYAYDYDIVAFIDACAFLRAHAVAPTITHADLKLVGFSEVNDDVLRVLNPGVRMCVCYWLRTQANVASYHFFRSRDAPPKKDFAPSVKRIEDAVDTLCRELNLSTDSWDNPSPGGSAVVMRSLMHKAGYELEECERFLETSLLCVKDIRARTVWPGVLLAKPRNPDTLLTELLGAIIAYSDPDEENLLPSFTTDPYDHDTNANKHSGTAINLAAVVSRSRSLTTGVWFAVYSSHESAGTWV